MALTVEDGTGLANAQTYISAADTRAYALARGIALPAIANGVDPVESLLVLAADWLGAQTWIGYPQTTTQALSWPRVRAYVCDNILVGIPTKLRFAQAQLVIESNNGIVLLPSTQGIAQGGGVIIESTVGPITTKWSDKQGIASGAIMPSVTALLSGLIATTNSGYSLRVRRV